MSNEGVKHKESVSHDEENYDREKSVKLRTVNGVVLVPQPTDDPADPLVRFSIECR